MANRNGSGKYRVDRRGTTVLVPIGIGAVFAMLAFLMLARSSHEDASPPPDNVGSKTTSSKVQR
jgi:hypothetical protein